MTNSDEPEPDSKGRLDAYDAAVKALASVAPSDRAFLLRAIAIAFGAETELCKLLGCAP